MHTRRQGRRALAALARKQLYIETILQDDDPDDPTIQIVSIHDA